MPLCNTLLFKIVIPIDGLTPVKQSDTCKHKRVSLASNAAIEAAAEEHVCVIGHVCEA